MFACHKVTDLKEGLLTRCFKHFRSRFLWDREAPVGLERLLCICAPIKYVFILNHKLCLIRASEGSHVYVSESKQAD